MLWIIITLLILISIPIITIIVNAIIKSHKSTPYDPSSEICNKAGKKADISLPCCNTDYQLCPLKEGKDGDMTCCLKKTCNKAGEKADPDLKCCDTNNVLCPLSGGNKYDLTCCVQRTESLPGEPRAPPFWNIKNSDYPSFLYTSWNSTKGNKLFLGRPGGVCKDQPKIEFGKNYVMLSGETGCNSRSTGEQSNYIFNPPRPNTDDKELRIEFWTEMSIGDGTPENIKQAADDIFAAVWMEGVCKWPETGEIDIMEWCCPGSVFSSMHDIIADNQSIGTKGFWCSPYADRVPKNNVEGQQYGPYNILVHVYIVWKHNSFKIYLGTEKDKDIENENHLVLENNIWPHTTDDDSTNWWQGWVIIFDIKRTDKGTEGEPNTDPNRKFEKKPYKLWLSDIRITGGGPRDTPLHPYDTWCGSPPAPRYCCVDDGKGGKKCVKNRDCQNIDNEGKVRGPPIKKYIDEKCGGDCGPFDPDDFGNINGGGCW